MLHDMNFQKEKLELADVIFNQNLEQCGLLPSLHIEKQRCESNSSEECEEGKIQCKKAEIQKQGKSKQKLKKCNSLIIYIKIKLVKQNEKL